MKKIATTWSRPPSQGQAPRPRCSHASCFLDHKLVIYGGWSSGNRFLDDVHIYATDTNTWSQPKLSGESRVRVGHSMTAGDKPGEIWVIGGTMGAASALDVQLLNIDSLAWSSPSIEGTPPEARSRHTANRHGSKIYLFGGGDNQRLFNDVWVLDLSTRSWSIATPSGTPPSGRWGHTTTLVDVRLFVFGGHDGSNRLNDVHILDLTTMTWSTPDCRPRPAPSPRTLVSSSSSPSSPSPADDGSSIGEANGSKVTETSSAPSSPPVSVTTSGDASPMSSVSSASSSPRAQPLSQPLSGNVVGNSLTGLPPARAGHTANCLGRKLIIYGGGDGKLLGDMYYLHVDTYEWASMESGNVPDRCAHTSEVFHTPQGMRLLVFGGSNGIKTFNDLHVVTCSKNRLRTPSGKKKSSSILRTSAPSDATTASSNTPNASTSNHTTGSLKLSGSAGQSSPPQQRRSLADNQTATPASSSSASDSAPETSSSSSSSQTTKVPLTPLTPLNLNTRIITSGSSPRSPKSPKSPVSPKLSYKDVLQSSNSREPAKTTVKSITPRGNSSDSPRSHADTSSASASSTTVQSSDRLLVLLKEVGLEKYHQRFVEQEISFDQLSSLTDTHYQALGLTSIRELALAAKLKERARAPSPLKSRQAQTREPTPKVSTASATPSVSGNAPNANVNSMASGAPVDLVRQVQLSTDALAIAASSLRAAASQAILAEE